LSGHFDGDNLPIEELSARGKNRFTDGVRVGQAKVMRTRCKIDEGATTVEVRFNDELLNVSEVKRILEVAGEQVGLLDWRPRFGRFNVEILK
jgi:hypothetical protein